MELTEVKFWDEYWANCKLPSTIDYSESFDRCLAQALKENISGAVGDVLEVGCAPGKWLAFMNAEFGLKPNGIEYSEAGMKATIKNFQLLGLESGRIQTGDFFKIQPDRQFDVVMSFGFIEHFTNVDEVVALHMQWLKPGGLLILGVPNFRGIYSVIQKILDKQILDKHNLDIMSLEHFRNMAVRHLLTPIYIEYIGSFEPSLPIAIKGKTNWIQFLIKVGIRIAKVIRNIKYFDSMNGPSYSSYILAVYRKKEEPNIG